MIEEITCRLKSDTLACITHHLLTKPALPTTKNLCSKSEMKKGDELSTHFRDHPGERGNIETFGGSGFVLNF